MQANWACATAKQSGPAHVHCHRPELRCAPASEEELPAEETAVHPASDTCKLVVECRFIRIPHLHQTRRTGAGESLAPRLLATRYYYRTRTGDAPEKTASRNCAASS